MAIQVNLTTDSGPTYPAAYINIENSGIIKNAAGFEMWCLVNVYAEKQYRDAKKPPLFTGRHRFVVVDMTEPLYPQLYAGLKALPKFAGAIDV